MLEVPAPANGVVREIKVQSGAVVTSGQVLAIIEEGAAAPRRARRWRAAAPAPKVAPQGRRRPGTARTRGA